MHREPDLNSLFPRDVYGRIALALTGLFFLPISAFTLFWVLVRAPAPNGVVGWLVMLGLGEVCSAFFLFASTDLVWAIATPQWLERALHKVTSRLAISLTLIVLPGAIIALYSLWLV